MQQDETLKADEHILILGAGEMARRIAGHDWSASLGPVASWPPSLKTAAGLLVRSAVPMVLLWGEDGIMIYNDAYSVFAGARHPQILGSKVRDSWPEVASFNDNVMQVVRSGRNLAYRDLELTLYRSGRPEQVWMNLDYSLVFDESGGPGGVLAIVVETTERVRADAALRESEARLRQLNANLEREAMDRSAVGGQFWQINPDLLCILTPDAVCTRANPAWTAMLGWTEAELQAMPLFDLLHPGDLERTRGGFEHLMKGNPILRFENRYRRKDGGYEWIAWAAAPHGNEFFCSGRNITAEKHQADIIAQRNAELKRVWEHSRDLQVVVGADGIFQSVNHAWTEILGHDPSEIVGRSFLDFILPEDATYTLSGLETAATVADLTNFENRYRHKDGTQRWISWHTSVEGDRVYAYGRDITAEKLACADLVNAQEALRQAQKMDALGQLTGGIAHDFNNLLAGIGGNLELLENRLADKQYDSLGRYISSAQSATRRAASLTQRLLAFSRRQTLAPKPTDINRLIASMEELIRRSVGPSVDVEVVGAGGLWATEIDPSQLESALLNLCINARDAMAPAGGRITIETANKWLDERAAKERDLFPGQFVSLCVSDTGSGMEPGVIARAFDPFFTTKPLGKGTGLGLSMVYGFVRQSGGQVRIYSEPGKGTTMCLYMPRYAGTAGEAEVTAALERIDQGDGETVLVIDDEPTVRMLIVEILEENGYVVIEAVDGPSGLRVLESAARIDLLITDVGLPGGLNGRQVADAARIIRPGLKVLFVTGYAENAAFGNGYLEPGMEVLTKPFVVAGLGNKIRTLIDT